MTQCLSTLWDEAASLFDALGYPTRLQLLSRLKEPRVLEELDVGPGPDGGPGNPGRVLTRQGIRHHLNQLVSTGLLTVDRANREGHAANVYRASPARLFAGAQMLQELAGSGTIRSVPGLMDGGPAWQASPATATSGPRLVLVAGIGQGNTYTLDRRRIDPEAGWAIGSAPGAEVPISYDAYAAHKETVIVPKGDRFEVVDLRGSRQPTYVDWVPLETGGARELEHGAVIGVGRSLLLFRTD